jgi:hypothetical protein
MRTLTITFFLCLLGSAPLAAQDDLPALRERLAAQQKQIEQLTTALAEQQKLLEALAQKTAAAPAAVQPPSPGGEAGKVATSAPAAASPLQFALGSAYFTPVGFMDFTSVFRDTDPGSNIGTNFGSFPYRTAAATNANLSEFRMSPQNSRIGMRVDEMVKGAKVLGYWESDFLGGVNNPPVGNLAVSTNSYPFRLRLFFVDVRKDKWEVLGGQSWSLMTPGRNGISPLPGDLFYSQVIDVNYIVGFPWGRIPEFRFVYHPSTKVTAAFALDNPEQYIGGSGGAGVTVLPTAFATPYASELNNGTTTLNVPNMHPDLIAKVAFDPSRKLHFEVAGVERTFEVYSPTTAQRLTKNGGGGSANVNFELAKGLRVISNNYLSDGGGRYVFGEGPDVVVKGDGSLGLVHTDATSDGLEFTHKKTLLYGYFGMDWIGKYAVTDPSNGKQVGYGYTGSSNSQNRNVQEYTIGFNQTLWKDAKYGALNIMGQYALFTRVPWYVASGTPSGTHMNEVWVNLRFTLPGSAPMLP